MNLQVPYWTRYLKEAHRGLGYLLGVLLLAVLVWCLVEILADTESNESKAWAIKTTVGLADLQVLLGLILYVLYPSGARPSMEHPAVMILAVGLLHYSSKRDGWIQVGLLVLSAVFIGRGIMIVI
ncbi:MAG: hypothetical protein ABEK50_09705 [bacterium]